MVKRTIGDVWDAALLSAIGQARTAKFREQAASWLVATIGLTDAERLMFEYPCLRCRKFHYRWSKAGKAHQALLDTWQPQARGPRAIPPR